MQDAVQFFGVHKPVGNNAGDGRHKQRGKRKGGKNSPELDACAEVVAEKPGSNGNEPCTPNKKLEKAHYRKPQPDVHAVGKV